MSESAFAPAAIAPALPAARLIGRVGPTAVAALLLTWPALCNGYPLVFADTGTYLGQAIDLYLGWDRPVFYSLLMRALHWRLTTWPVVAAQAALIAWLLGLMLRSLRPAVSRWWLVGLSAALALLTPLPFVVAQLMPDVFASVVVLAVMLPLAAPDRLRPREHWVLFAAGVVATAVHNSHLPLVSLLLLLVLPLLRPVLGVRFPPPPVLRRLIAIPCVAALAAVGVNLVGHHRAAVAPFGNVFLLARVLYDGPGLAALQRECPATGWRLCPFRDAMPPDSDRFLWDRSSPLYVAGGPKLVSDEADAIIAAALRDDPLGELGAVTRHAVAQFARFGAGTACRRGRTRCVP